jgi:hypothetical protein
MNRAIESNSQFKLIMLFAKKTTNVFKWLYYSIALKKL